MKMQNYSNLLFNENRWLTVFVIFFFPVLIALGSWQISRAEWRADQLFQLSVLHNSQPQALHLDRVYPTYTPIALKGEWLNDKSFVLFNRTREGQMGVEVLTPLLVGHHVVVVNRGFAPWGYGSERFIPTDAEYEQVVGIVAPTDINPTLDHQANQQYDLQTRDLAHIEAVLGLPVLFELRIRPEHPDALTAYWPSQTMTPDKHYGYAIQWFSLAAVLLIMYCGVIIKTKKSKGEDHDNTH